MKFDNSFEVYLPPDQAWPVLMDVERIAPCMPGAALTEVVDDKTFKGTVSIRLGPVALTFEGEAQFEEIDETAHTASVRARGRDPKGRGGADATVTFRLESSDAGSTVLIETDLTLSGSVAQYGRGVGMIQSVASQLIGQFAKALEDVIAGDIHADAPPENGATSPEPKPVAEDKPATEPQAISGLSLFFAALGNWFRGLIGR